MGFNGVKGLRCIDTFNGVFVLQGPPQPGQPFKFSVGESCDRIKEEFNFLQAQYHRYLFSFRTNVFSSIAVNWRCTDFVTINKDQYQYNQFVTFVFDNSWQFLLITQVKLYKLTSSLSVSDINIYIIFLN